MNRKATLYYHDIGDCLTREQKLARVKESGSAAVMLCAGAFTVLQPNRHSDRITLRDEGCDARNKKIKCRVDGSTESVHTRSNNTRQACLLDASPAAAQIGGLLFFREAT
jgi:predicted helicase